MTNLAIPALLRKRAELTRGIDQRQGESVNMLSELNALDCAIRLFDPGIELPEAIMKPLPVNRKRETPCFSWMHQFAMTQRNGLPDASMTYNHKLKSHK